MEAILTSFGLGLIATTNPCILPLYPGFIAYLSANQAASRKMRYFLGIFVLFGVLTMMLLLGAIIALLAIPIGSALAITIPIADLILLTLGVLLIFDINPFKKIPQIQVPGFKHPLASAYLYGLLYGPITLPCSGALVVAIFAYSFTAGEVLAKLSVFFWFGLGFGFPLLLISILSGSLQRKITRFFAIHSRKVNLAGGILLVTAAIYDIAVNFDLIISNFSRLD